MSDEFLRRGESHLKQAQKKAKSNWFSKPEWFMVAAEYDNAANAFNSGQYFEKAAECWIKSAEAHEKDGNYYQTAILYEKAANLYATKLKDPVGAARCLQESSRYFRLKDSADRAAKAMEKAADMIDQLDPVEASELYMKAVHILRDESRGRIALETYYKVLAYLVTHSRYREASELREILLDTCRQISKEGRSSQFVLNKCYMCLVLVALYNNDIIDAKKRLQEFGAEGVSGLGFNHSSREYDASQKLLDAYNNSEPDELQGALAEIGVLVPYPSIFQLAVKIRARGMDKKPQRQHPAPPIISPGESYGSQGHGEEEASDDDELL